MRPLTLPLLLLLAGCDKPGPAAAPPAPPATPAPAGVEVFADTARVTSYATVFVDSGGVLRVEPGETDSAIAAWLRENRFEYAGFDVDTAATRTLQELGMQAEDPSREAVYGAVVYHR